jgi:hypothetical protein
MSTSESKTEFFGNYIDQDWSGAFGSRISYHNATDFINTTGMFTTDIMLGVGDNLINRGYLRIIETVKPIKNLNVSAGFRTNCFDLIKYSDETLGYRSFIGADYEVLPKLVPYLEVGFTDRERIRPRLLSYSQYYNNLSQNDPDYYQHPYLYQDYSVWVDSLNHRMKQYDRLTPITAGISVPTGGYLDLAGIEGELLLRDQLKKIGLDNANMANVNIYLVKNFGRHANLRLSFYTDPTTDSYGNWDFALRFTSGF